MSELNKVRPGMHQVHVYRRGAHSGMSSWQALAPKRKRHMPVPRPDLFSFEEAEDKVTEIIAAGECDANIRIVGS